MANLKLYGPDAKFFEGKREDKIVDVNKERNQCVALIAHMASAIGIPVGLGKHKENDDGDWINVVFIELPTGQLSWRIHDSEVSLFSYLPPYLKQWDGHSSEEKYARIRQMIESSIT